MRGAANDTSQTLNRTSARLLDARAWHGPWCLLKIRGFQSRLAPGSLVRILIEDPQTAKDLALFLEKQGHLILERTQSEMLVKTSSEAIPAFSRPDDSEQKTVNTQRRTTCHNC